MDPMDNSFEGISQGTLDWINETFMLFHSSHDSSPARLDGEGSPSQLTQAGPPAITSTRSNSEHYPQRDVYLGRISEPLSEFDHDALHRSLAQELVGASHRSSSRNETRPLSLGPHHHRQSSGLSFRLPPTVAPTPSTTTSTSPTHTHGPTWDSDLPTGRVHTTASSFNEQQAFGSHQKDHGALFSKPRSAVSHGVGAYMLPTPALTSQESSISNRSPSYAYSTPNNQPDRSAEPPQNQSNVSPYRRRTEPGPHTRASTSIPKREQSVQMSPHNTSHPPLIYEPITWPSMSAYKRQNESIPILTNAVPDIQPYLFTTHPSFPAEAASSTARAPPTLVHVKQEPPEQTSLQGVFHSSPVHTAPARVNALEKNRLAARKSRTKKRDYIETLAVQSREYTTQNRHLRSKVGELREEVKGLRDTIRLHRGCGGWSGEMQIGVESYLRRVDERQEEEGRKEAEEREVKEEDDEMYEDYDMIMEANGKG